MTNSTTKTERHHFTIRNITRQCTVDGCNAPRHGLGRLCRLHRGRATRNGHPLASTIKVAVLGPRLARMTRFIAEHRDTAQVQMALAVTEEFLREGVYVSGSRGSTAADVRRELRRLTDQGVTPEDALAVIGAVWLVSVQDPRHLPNDDRLSFALANRLLKMRPYHFTAGYHGGKRVKVVRHFPGAYVYRALGSFIRDHLGLFLMNVAAAVEAEDSQQAHAQAVMARPFSAPSNMENVPT